MKYRTRSGICRLLAGLIISTVSCTPKAPPGARLLAQKDLNDFPSASALEYHNDRLYVFGDDAAYLLVLDSSYNRLDTIRLSTDTAYRIAKASKADIESAAIVDNGDLSYLYALGSLSAPGRMKLFVLPLDSTRHFLSIDYTGFTRKVPGIREFNIEGMAVVNGRFVLANRANTTNRINRLIVAGSNPEDLTTEQPSVIELALDAKSVAGISGLCYVEEKDLLLFTASEEDTPSATQDGIIRDSYLGWIDHFSERLRATTLKPDGWLPLAPVAPAFRLQKIESVCLQAIRNDELILHLAADNDNGQSRLFKLGLKL